MVTLRGSPVYAPAHSPAIPGQQSYPGGLTNWSLSRASFLPSPRLQGPSSYAQLILPQGLVQVPGWNPYPVSLAPPFLLLVRNSMIHRERHGILPDYFLHFAFYMHYVFFLQTSWQLC